MLGRGPEAVDDRKELDLAVSHRGLGRRNRAFSVDVF
jgi:hypothetical protein